MYAPLANFQTITHKHFKWLQKEKRLFFYKLVLESFFAPFTRSGYLMRIKSLYPNADVYINYKFYLLLSQLPKCMYKWSLFLSLLYVKITCFGQTTFYNVFQQHSVLIVYLQPNSQSLTGEYTDPAVGLYLAGRYDNPMPELTKSPQFRDYELGYSQSTYI